MSDVGGLGRESFVQVSFVNREALPCFLAARDSESVNSQNLTKVSALWYYFSMILLQCCID